MNLMYSLKRQQQLKACLKLLKMILGPDLLGVYLYGSSAVGGLQKYSDLDLFVVANRRADEKVQPQFWRYKAGFKAIETVSQNVCWMLWDSSKKSEIDDEPWTSSKSIQP